MQANFKSPVSLSCHPLSGNTCYRYFAWVLPNTGEVSRSKKDSLMVAVLLSELIPRQLRAEEEAALTEAYKSPSVNLPKGVVLFLLKLMGLSSADRHRNSTRDDPKKQHVEMFIQNSDNAFVQNLVAAGYTPTDMRRLNGQSEDAAFTDFIDVVHEMLPKRDQLAGEERRDGAPSSGAPAGKAAAIRPSSCLLYTSPSPRD